MDPPWLVGEPLDYPLLKFHEILTIPFDTLQSEGFVMIWVLVRTELQTMNKMEELGYKYKSRITWKKLTKKGNPVNGNGYIARHSTEALLIFAKG